MSRQRWARRGVLAVMAVAIAAVTLPLPGAGAQADGTPETVRLVRLPFPQDDGTLTPYTFELGYSLMTLVYDTLLWRDAEGTPQPWLARSVDTSPDGRRLTVHLVEGARWHDGAPVTAADVAFTFAFVASHPHPRFTPEVAAVDRTEVVDPLTVTIDLKYPSPGFMDQPLADLPILPAHLWEGLPRDRLAPDGLPVGSGPYRLVDHRPGEAYRFEANTAYFRGPPVVQAIEVPIINDAEQTLQGIERRSVDMLPVNLPRDAATRVDSVSTRVVDGPSYLGTVLLFNVRSPPFDRREVRRAVAEAIDLVRIGRALGNAVPADHGYLHPASSWSSKEVLHVFDEQAARAALATADLGPVEILVPDNDPVRREAGRQVALALERAGVQAETKALPRSELSHAVGEDGAPPSFGMAIWSAPPLASYDPDFLRRQFGSPPEDGSLNYGGYRSPAFSELARRIASTPDDAARHAAVTDVLRLLADDVPAVPLVFASGRYVFRPAIHDGWVYVKGSGILDKRSFLETGTAPPARPVPQAGPDAGGSSSPGPFGLVALGILGLAAVLAGGLAVSWLRDRRARR